MEPCPQYGSGTIGKVVRDGKVHHDVFTMHPETLDEAITAAGTAAHHWQVLSGTPGRGKGRKTRWK